MKIARALIGVVILVGLALGGWWFLSRKTGVPSPGSVLAPSPIAYKEKLTIEAGKFMNYTISAPNGKAPGRLYGRWMSRGSSAGVKGATDDTLVGFKLVGPDNKVLEKL